nr:MAG TPA: hypothetical protein [Bacteriophage sp.]
MTRGTRLSSFCFTSDRRTSWRSGFSSSPEPNGLRSVFSKTSPAPFMAVRR